ATPCAPGSPARRPCSPPRPASSPPAACSRSGSPTATGWPCGPAPAGTTRPTSGWWAGGPGAARAAPRPRARGGPVAACGVGVFADADDDLDPDELATLVELERLVAGREPYRSSARTLHLVARCRVFRPELPGDRL